MKLKMLAVVIGLSLSSLAYAGDTIEAAMTDLNAGHPDAFANRITLISQDTTNPEQVNAASMILNYLPSNVNQYSTYRNYKAIKVTDGNGLVDYVYYTGSSDHGWIQLSKDTGVGSGYESHLIYQPKPATVSIPNEDYSGGNLLTRDVGGNVFYLISGATVKSTGQKVTVLRNSRSETSYIVPDNTILNTATVNEVVPDSDKPTQVDSPATSWAVSVASEASEDSTNNRIRLDAADKREQERLDHQTRYGDISHHEVVSSSPFSTTTTTVRRGNTGNYEYGDNQKFSLDETLANVGQRTVENEHNITTNTGKIAQNEQNIATNTAGIATNSGRLDNHEQRISTNEQNIASNSARIDSNKADSDSQFAEVNRKGKEVGDAVLKNTDEINVNRNAINTHTERLNRDESVLNEQGNAITQVQNWTSQIGSDVANNSASIYNHEERLGNVEQHQKEQDKTIKANDKKAMAGVSSAMAMAGLHYTTDNNSIALGAGSYAGGSATAIGYQHTFGSVRYSAQASIDSTGQAGVSGSVAVGW